MKKPLQITERNNYLPAELKSNQKSSLRTWLELYFQFEDNTSENSRKTKRRDLELFVLFLEDSTKADDVKLWTPRMTRLYIDKLKSTMKNDRRRWNDRSINRMVAHVKTFAKWIHKHNPFPLGDPTEKIRAIPTASTLEIERAVTKTERARILDAADNLVETGGRSSDRHRHRSKVRPRWKTYRPIRNRAIIYPLMETGMRRAAVVKLNINDIDESKRVIHVVEKGGVQQAYHISKEGLRAVLDYIDSEEYQTDSKKWQTSVLFLAPATSGHGNGRMRRAAINDIWNQVCKHAGVEGRTPHSARHAMGRHIMEKTGNVAAIQRQLGHKNPAYSMQYARITSDELKSVLDDR